MSTADSQVSADGVDYRGSSYEDLRRLIRSEVSKACWAYGIDVKQYGDDLEQEGWVIVLRKLPVYKDMGYKVTTYLFSYIRRDVRGAAPKIVKHGQRSTPTEDEYLHTLVGAKEEFTRDVDWDQIHPFVLLAACKYTDDEIAKITGEENVSRRRQQAHRELLAAAAAE